MQPIDVNVDLDDALNVDISLAAPISVPITLAPDVIISVDVDAVGPAGPAGVGIPSGGTTGQILKKNSNTDYDTVWDTASGSGTVTSVNGTGANGVSVSGGPITSSGSLTIGLGAITPSSVAAVGTVTGSNLSGTNTGDQNLSGYAPLASPALTGTPTAPTATVGTNTTQLATTAFTVAQIASNDALDVHIAGPETITGTKTFTPAPILSNGLQTTAITPPAYAAGQLYFDSTTDALTFRNSDSNVSLQVGQEEWIRVVNNTGSTIANGAAIYLNGASSGMPTIALAQANAPGTTVVAGLTTESIANGATGFVTCIGNVNGIDTSAFTAGQTVYLSSTVAGGLTATAPSAPNYRYRVGIVGVSSASVGTIHVTPSTASLGNGTANQVFGINAAGTGQEVKTIQGTASQVTVTHTANTVTLSLPASINVPTTSSAATLTTARTIGILTGDITATGSTFNGSANNTNATTLATVNSNVGSFGSASQVMTQTVNAKGLTTAAANVSIQIAESQVTNLVTDLAAKQGTLTLTTTGGSGAATLVGNTLNIPIYSGGGGGSVTSVTSATTDATVANTTTTPAITIVGAPQTDITVTQTAHGFSLGTPVYWNGTAYVASKADAAANAGVEGLVSTVVNANSFILTENGGPITGLSGLTSGSIYYVSPTTAGALTATDPSTVGQVSKPVGKALSTTSLLVNIGRGVVIASVGAGTVTNTGGSLTSNSVMLGAGTNDSKVATDITSNGGGKLILGTAGTTAGILTLQNNTSGFIDIKAVVGTALGSSSWVVPAALSETFVGRATTDTFTNKDLTSGTNTFPTFNQNTTGSAATLTTSRTIGTLTGDVTSTGSGFNGSANNTNSTTVTRINGTALSGLATGILKNTTTTGVPSIAVAGTDYEVPLTFSTGLTRSTNTITVNTSQNIATLSNLTSNGSVQTTGGTGALSIVANTGTGSNVLATSPTLVTPVLGAATGTSIALGGGTALTTTNQTGTGNLVLASSPTIVTPTIASFTNATHTHTNAAGGGTLGATALALTVSTQTNAGTAAGSINYINLGGIKMAWGVSANQTSSAAGINYTITLPTSFFTTITSVVGTAANMTVDGRQYVAVGSFNTTTVTFGFISPGGAATTAVSWQVMGT